MTETEATNPECPDYSAHFENAWDRLFPEARGLTTEQDEAVRAEAEAEYLGCEGH